MQRSRAECLRGWALLRMGTLCDHRANRACIAIQTAAPLAVKHDTAAYKGVDEDIDEALGALPQTGHQLGHAGCGGVFDKQHRNLGVLCE